MGMCAFQIDFSDISTEYVFEKDRNGIRENGGNCKNSVKDYEDLNQGNGTRAKKETDRVRKCLESRDVGIW